MYYISLHLLECPWEQEFSGVFGPWLYPQLLERCPECVNTGLLKWGYVLTTTDETKVKTKEYQCGRGPSCSSSLLGGHSGTQRPVPPRRSCRGTWRWSTWKWGTRLPAVARPASTSSWCRPSSRGSRCFRDTSLWTLAQQKSSCTSMPLSRKPWPQGSGPVSSRNKGPRPAHLLNYGSGPKKKRAK